MRGELPVLLQGFLKKPALDVAVSLSKETLRQEVSRVKGDKALIDASVSSAWATALRHETCGIPGFSDDKYAELIVICAKLAPGVREAKVARLQALLHIAVCYPLLLVLEGEGTVRVSAKLDGDTIEQMISVTLTAPAKAFVGDLTVPQDKPAPHLMAVYHRWFCAIHAQLLHQSPPLPNLELPYKRLLTPEDSARAALCLRSLELKWKEVSSALKHAVNPQDRINLAKQRKNIVNQIKSDLKQLKLLS